MCFSGCIIPSGMYICPVISKDLPKIDLLKDFHVPLLHSIIPPIIIAGPFTFTSKNFATMISMWVVTPMAHGIRTCNPK